MQIPQQQIAINVAKHKKTCKIIVTLSKHRVDNFFHKKLFIQIDGAFLKIPNYGEMCFVLICNKINNKTKMFALYTHTVRRPPVRLLDQQGK